MINNTLASAAKLQLALIVADTFLSGLPADTPYDSFELRLVFHYSIEWPQDNVIQY